MIGDSRVVSLATPWILLCLIPLSAGCTRTKYRKAADRDAYRILFDKTYCMPWMLPSNFDVYPQAGSRLCNPSPTDDPLLPIPSPQLYCYQIPQLAPRDPRRFRAGSQLNSATNQALENHSPRFPNVPAAPILRDQRLPGVRLSQNISPRVAGARSPTSTLLPPLLSPVLQMSRSVFPVSHEEPLRYEISRLPRVDEGTGSFIRPASHSYGASAEAPLADDRPADGSLNDEGQVDDDERSLEDNSTFQRPGDDSGTRLTLRPVAVSAWQTLPRSCLQRMFEFDSVRYEYSRSFRESPSERMFDDSPRLSLEDIVELALLNSREYQTQKEALYVTALALTFDRYQYEMKFSPFGNGTDANYTNNRTGGVEVNTLSVPSRYQLEKMLATGGDFLARFTNNVILTFNGPTGFAQDISSELFYELNQTVFQRDVRFESLTQAERDVIYAARDFARFRKLLFTQLASQYYNLILTYRQIEIDSQNYFTLVQALDQQENENLRGFTPRFQVDQIEQNVLNGRSRLIGTCNSLEQALDNLKIRMGLPTESPINIDLTELLQLSTRDEIAVTLEQIRRVRRRIDIEKSSRTPDLGRLYATGILLVDRILKLVELRSQLDEQSDPPRDLIELRAVLTIESSRLVVEQAQQELEDAVLEQAEDEQSLSQINRILQRSMTLIEELLALVYDQIQLAQTRETAELEIQSLMNELDAIYERAEAVPTLDDLLRERAQGADAQQAQELFASMSDIVRQFEAIRNELEALARRLDQSLGTDRTGISLLQRRTLALDHINEVMQASEQLSGIEAGLVPVEIDFDDAMMTALVLRFDLMNERGRVADDWRQIKYAADDLKSILNLRASHSRRTPPGENKPFAFSLDDSTTQLSASLDLPLNRRAQRNNFRGSLINYQAALRQLVQLQDNIKLSVRDDLRALSLGKEQYSIDVASAALASDRVTSTEIELRLGLGGVAARDFLESQNAYAGALSSVARRHIAYVLDRMQLFFDLELLGVDEMGFWHEIYQEQYQPEPYHQIPAVAYPAYGYLHPRLWYSPKIKRMTRVPNGFSHVHAQQPSGPAEQEQPGVLPPPGDGPRRGTEPAASNGFAPENGYPPTPLENQIPPPR